MACLGSDACLIASGLLQTDPTTGAGGIGPMRVIFVPSTYPDLNRPTRGIFYRDHAVALQGFVSDVTVVYPHLLGPRSVLASLRRHGKAGWLPASTVGPPSVHSSRHLHSTRLTGRSSSAVWTAAAVELYATLARRIGGADVVYAHCALDAGVAALLIRRRFGTPYVLMEHSSLYARGLASRAQLRASEEVYECAAQLIAVSPRQAADLSRFFPTTSGRWTVISNVLQSGFVYRPKPGPRSFDPIRPLFLNIGALNENKGHADLLHAFALVLARIPSARLEVIGDGTLLHQLRGLAETLGVASAVRWCGGVPAIEVPSHVAASDVVVLSSHYETFGLAAAEALAVGRPVVATRSGGPEHIVHPPGDGVLVPPRDHRALAAGMLEAVDQYGRFEGSAISSRALARFGASAVMPRVVAALTSATVQQRGPLSE